MSSVLPLLGVLVFALALLFLHISRSLGDRFQSSSPSFWIKYA